MYEKKTLIGVIGSGTENYPALSEPIGRWLAERNFNLINGGGGGVMSAVSQAFAEVPNRKGSVIGVIPASGPCDSSEARSAYSPPAGYPNTWIDIPIHTHLHLSGASGKEIASRNHIIILSADVIVAFPGGAGTRSEIQLALEYRKPLIILNFNKEWGEFQDTQALMVSTLEEALLWLAKHIPPTE